MKRLKFVFLTSEGKRHHFYPKLKTDKLTNSDIKFCCRTVFGNPKSASYSGS